MPRVAVAAYAVLVVAFVALAGGNDQPSGVHGLKLNPYKSVKKYVARLLGLDGNKIEPGLGSAKMKKEMEQDIQLQTPLQKPTPTQQELLQVVEDEALRTFPVNFQPGMLVQVEGLNKEDDVQVEGLNLGDERQHLNGFGWTLLKKEHDLLDRPYWEAYFSHNKKVHKVLDTNLKFIWDAQKKFEVNENVFIQPTFKLWTNKVEETPNSMEDRICTLIYDQTSSINNKQWIMMREVKVPTPDKELFAYGVFYYNVDQSHMILLHSDDKVEGILEKIRRGSFPQSSRKSRGMLVVAEGLRDSKLSHFNGRQCTLLDTVQDASNKLLGTKPENNQSLQGSVGQWFAFCPESTATGNEIIRLPEANMRLIAMPKNINTQELRAGQLVYYHNDMRWDYNYQPTSTSSHEENELDKAVFHLICKVEDTKEGDRLLVCPDGDASIPYILDALVVDAGAKLIAILNSTVAQPTKELGLP